MNRIQSRLLLVAWLSATALAWRGRGTAPAADAGAVVRPAREARVVEVVIREFSFRPDSVRVAPGTEVRWVNRDALAHTSTAEDGEWESPLLGPGETYSTRFDDEGVHPYYCTPHPFMRGVVIVEAGAGTE